MIEAQLPDGRVLEFPDGTDPAVIQRKVKELLGMAGAQPVAPASAPLEAMPGSATAVEAQQNIAQGLGAGGDVPPIPDPIVPTSPNVGYVSAVSKEPAFKTVDDFIRSMADIITSGGADEFAAFMNEQTGAAPGTYEQLLKKERKRDREIPLTTRIPGMLAGAALTGGIAGLPRLVGRGVSTVGKAARGAAAGGTAGGLYGFGSGEGLEDRIAGAKFGAGAGALAGGLIGGAAGALKKSLERRKIPSAEKLKEAATSAYQRAEAAGVIIRKDSFAAFAGRVQQKMAKRGIDRDLDPNAMAALRRIQDDTRENITLEGIEILRRNIKKAIGKSAPQLGQDPLRADRSLSTRMLSMLDEYVNGLGQADLLTGSTKAIKELRNARGLWSRSAKSETITDMMVRAKNKAGQFSRAGLENAIRKEFQSLSTTPSRMRLWSKAEQKQIERASRGTNWGLTMRFLSKFAPTGVIPAVLSGSAAASIGGAPLVGTVFAAGTAARAAALRSRKGLVRELDEMVRSGGAKLDTRLSAAQRRPVGALTRVAATLPQKELDEVPTWLRRLLSGERGSLPLRVR